MKIIVGSLPNVLYKEKMWMGGGAQCIQVKEGYSETIYYEILVIVHSGSIRICQ